MRYPPVRDSMTPWIKSEEGIEHGTPEGSWSYMGTRLKSPPKCQEGVLPKIQNHVFQQLVNDTTINVIWHLQQRKDRAMASLTTRYSSHHGGHSTC